MFDFFEYAFIGRALLAGIAVAITSPLIGIFMTVRRQSLIADTLSHSALAGVALGVAFGFNPFFGSILAAITAGLLIERLRFRGKIASESTLALVLSGSLALAVVLMSAMGQFNSSVLQYLFGSITTVSTADLWFIGGVSFFSSLTIVIYFRQFFLLSFDEDIAAAQGLKTTWLNILLAVLTASVVAVGMQVVGILLMSALMIIPVLAADKLGLSFKQTAFSAVLLSLLSVIGGLSGSYYFDLAAGGTVVLVSLAFYFILSLWSYGQRGG